MVLLDNGCASREGLRVMPSPADLRGLVEHTFVELHEGAREWRVVPDASPHLIVTVLTQGRLRAGLVGARSSAAIIDRRERIATVGIRLVPGALAVIVKDSAREFLDCAVPLADAFPAALLTHLEISADASPSHMVAELLRLVRRVASAPAVPGVTLAERATREQSHREIGLSPKRVMRIQRLHRALWAARPRTLSWATIAHSSGYADQAHLTRECRSLLGDTPVQWLARGSADLFKTATRPTD